MKRPIVVVGGGVVGLHAALALASEAGRDVFVLEREGHVGAHASGRNSQIIHAGFAYPPGSLKARLCVAGNRLTYVWLERHAVAHARSGKWIVALAADEVAALDQIIAAARASGVDDLRHAHPGELARDEPGCHAFVAALRSPSSGRVDASDYLAALARALPHSGGHLVLGCAVTAIDPVAHVVETTRGAIEYDLLVNSAGLWADDVYRLAGGRRDLRVKPFKGEYYVWRTDAVTTAIYPVPSRFLRASRDDPRMTSNMGIHVHRDMSGALHVGPTQHELHWGARADYTLITPREHFIAQAARYAAVASDDDFVPGYAGNRAKVYEGGAPLADFQIFREGDHIHLLGIESPGLTAAPAIAQYVAQLARM